MAKKKYFVKGTRHEMNIGDDVNIFGIQTKLTQEVLDSFVNMGFFVVEEQKFPIKDIHFYLDKFTERLKGGNNPIVLNVIGEIGEKYPKVMFDILLKEIAKDLDKTHGGSIRDNGRAWFISSADLKPYPIQIDRTTCLNGFSAFWSKDEAEAALQVLNPLISMILNGK